VLHNAFGIFVCEQVFGDIIRMPNDTFRRMPYITLSSGKQVSVRDIAEQHVLDDLGTIPTLQDCMKGIELTTKNAGGVKKLILDKSVAYTIVD